MVGWAVAGIVMWCALPVGGLVLASSLTGGAVLPGFLAAGSSAPLPVQPVPSFHVSADNANPPNYSEAKRPTLDSVRNPA